MKTLAVTALVAALAWLLYSAWELRPASHPDWSAEQVAVIRSLSLERLPPLPPDPSNRAADDPRAARLGHALFFDTRLSGTETVACATCHQPARNFTDGLPKAVALGPARRNTPSIVGSAYSPWLYWDGRRDSLWAQALAPLEDPNEHGTNRLAVVRLVAENEAYRRDYEAVFGPLPDLSAAAGFPHAASPLGSDAERRAWEDLHAAARRSIDTAFANIGKALAAYQRKLLHGPSRFDNYAAALADDYVGREEVRLTAAEARGLELFIGKARCLECHNGPLFTNNEFHNTGLLSFPGDLPDRGRAQGLREARADPFNCRGEFSDDPARACGELDFAREGTELVGAFRTPSLRNLDGTAPFMHKGQFDTLEEVIEHYDEAPLAMIGHNEAEFPLSLSARERRQLEAFLRTLDSPVAVDEAWLRAPSGDTALSRGDDAEDVTRLRR